MPGFWIFIEGVTTADIVDAKQIKPEAVERYELGGLLADARAIPDSTIAIETKVTSDQVIEGEPGDGRGVLLYPKTKTQPSDWLGGGRLQFIRWRCKSGESRLIGLDPDNPPEPAEIVRPGSMVDYELTIDGVKWPIPVARSADPSRTSIPWSLIPTDSGEVERRIAAGYEDLWKLSGRVLGWLQNDEDKPTEAEQIAAAVAVLAANHRVDASAIRALNVLAGLDVLTTQTINAILFCLVDGDTSQQWADVQKKSDPPADNVRASA